MKDSTLFISQVRSERNYVESKRIIGQTNKILYSYTDNNAADHSSSFWKKLFSYSRFGANLIRANSNKAQIDIWIY